MESNRRVFYQILSEHLKRLDCSQEKTISGRQLLSVVCQVTIGLAIAEAAVEFEHRDLHISNILIRDTNDKQIDFIHRFNRYSVNSEGIEATIIDTTFSRIKYSKRNRFESISQRLTDFCFK